MWFGLVSILPELINAATRQGVFSRALADGIVSLDVFDPRDHSRDRHRTVDDRPYGGGPGMLMMVEPLLASINEARQRAAEVGISAQVVYLSPRGDALNQPLVEELAAQPGLIMVCGRYEGIDERLVELAVDRQLSIGDYVLTGGELPALVVMDAVSRRIPGTLGNSASAHEESHLDGLLDYPHYTRPEIAAGERVPTILTSGDHKAIGRWRLKQALRQTWVRRPDLLSGRVLTELERELLGELFAEQ